jgi:hypothetical protein
LKAALSPGSLDSVRLLVHEQGEPDRSSTKPKGEIAKHVVDVATGVLPRTPETEPLPEKNPAAVALGRLGGLEGGRARAKALSKKERVAISKKAARAR